MILQQINNEILRISELENCSLGFKYNRIQTLLFYVGTQNGNSYNRLEQELEYIMWCIIHPKYNTIRNYFKTRDKSFPSSIQPPA